MLVIYLCKGDLTTESRQHLVDIYGTEVTSCSDGAGWILHRDRMQCRDSRWRFHIEACETVTATVIVHECYESEGRRLADRCCRGLYLGKQAINGG